MNAIRQSVRHDINVAYRAEERARLREEAGEPEEEEGDGEEAREDPVPAITKAHFEVQYRIPTYSSKGPATPL